MLAVVFAFALLASGQTARPTPVLIAESAGTLNAPPVRIAGLIPLREDELRKVLRHPVRKWLGPAGRRRANLSFDSRGRAVDGGCDPASCEGRYVLRGNRVTIDWGRRGGPAQLHFFMTANGLVYEADAGDLARGVAMPW